MSQHVSEQCCTLIVVTFAEKRISRLGLDFEPDFVNSGPGKQIFGCF